MATLKIASPADIRTVLVVSHHERLALSLEGLFRQNKYFVVTETTAGHALQTANLLRPALTLFNLEPHNPAHVELCRSLRLFTAGAILLLAPVQENAQTFEYYQTGI